MDGVFEKALEEIAEPVQQHPLGMGSFEFHVVAEHRGELLRGDLAVVRPRRQIVVAVVFVVACGRRGFGVCFFAWTACGGLGMLFLALALTWALLGVLRQLVIIELIGLTLSVLALAWC